MTKKNSVNKNEKLLTDTELELMTILWNISEGTVTDVMGNLDESRRLAYTSVSTILRILEQKKILETRKEGRGHVYIPILSKKQYEAKAVNHIVSHVFEGAPTELIKHLLNSKDISSSEINEIKKLINKKEDSV